MFSKIITLSTLGLISLPAFSASQLYRTEPYFTKVAYLCKSTSGEAAEFEIKTLDKKAADKSDLPKDLIEEAEGKYVIQDSDINKSGLYFLDKEFPLEIKNDSGVISEYSYSLKFVAEQNRSGKVTGSYVYKEYSDYSLRLPLLGTLGSPKRTIEFEFSCLKK